MPGKKLRGKKKKKPVVAEKHPSNLQNYSLGKLLGRGAFGEVYQGLDLTNGSTVAIKTIQLTRFPDAMKGAQDEIELMSALKHDHIIKYIGSEKTDEFLYIIMEYAEGGSIQSIQKKFGHFDEHLVARYLYQMLQGLKYLHEQSIIHRDIKAANILISHNIAKLSDFGISVKLNEGTFNPSDSNCSPYWAAPEVILMEPITEKADIWSLGITAIEMFTGSPPYYTFDPIPAMYKIANSQETPLPADISPEFRDFLNCCLNRTVDFRKSTEELLEHRWIIAHISENVPLPFKPPDSPSTNSHQNAANSALSKFAETGDEDAFDDEFEGEGSVSIFNPVQNQHTLKSPLAVFSESKGDPLKAKGGTLADFMENEDIATEAESESDDVFEGDVQGPLAFVPVTQSTHPSKDLDTVFDEDANSQMKQVENEKLTKSMERIQQLLRELPEDASLRLWDDIQSKCDELSSILSDQKVKDSFIEYHCLVPLVTVIQTPICELLEIALPVFLDLISDLPKIKKGICVLGVLPTLFLYTVNEGDAFGKDIQLLALEILHTLATDLRTDKPLRMFIAAGGLTAIPRIMREYPHKVRPETTAPVFDIISAVFRLKTSAPTSSFTRMLAQAGTVELLGERFEQLSVEEPSFTQLCTIIKQFSEGDSTVKMRMATPTFISNLFSKAARKYNFPPTPLLGRQESEDVFTAINNLAMDKGVVMLLWKTTLVKELEPYLDINSRQIQISQQINLCFSTLYHLSRVLSDDNVPMIAPLIPMTIYIINKNCSLKELATQLLLDFIINHSQNEKMKLRLLGHDTLNTLFDLLSQHSHKEQIMAAFEAWTRSAPRAIEKFLVPKTTQFVEILDSVIETQPNIRKDIVTKLQHICSLCPMLSENLATSGLASSLIEVLINLGRDGGADVRLEFCSFLITLFQAHPNPKIMIAQFRLDRVVRKFGKDSSDSVRACIDQLRRAISSNYIL